MPTHGSFRVMEQGGCAVLLFEGRHDDGRQRDSFTQPRRGRTAPVSHRGHWSATHQV